MENPARKATREIVVPTVIASFFIHGLQNGKR